MSLLGDTDATGDGAGWLPVATAPDVAELHSTALLETLVVNSEPELPVVRPAQARGASSLFALCTVAAESSLSTLHRSAAINSGASKSALQVAGCQGEWILSEYLI